MGMFDSVFESKSEKSSREYSEGKNAAKEDEGSFNPLGGAGNFLLGESYEAGYEDEVKERIKRNN